MKIIVSHDIDHLAPFEHRFDTKLIKFILRAFVDYKNRFITTKELMLRLKTIAVNRWHNLDELIQFNREMNVPATFFIAVAPGDGIAYSPQKSVYWIQRIIDSGISIGVHGIRPVYENDFTYQFEKFKENSKLQSFGIRMHNLNIKPDTYERLAKQGYSFDSSELALKAPYKIGNMWEFPLHMMDAFLINKDASWQTQNLAQVQEDTIHAIEEAQSLKLKYLTILFHDNYFNDGFATWKNWYIWMINYLKDTNYSFINFQDAITELNQNHDNFGKENEPD